MEEELKNKVSLILRNLFEDVNDKIKKLSDEKMELEKQRINLSEQEVEQEYFNFFDRNIFKRKEYREYLENRKKRNQEYSEKTIELNQKMTEIDDRVDLEKKNAEKLKSLIDNPSLIEIRVLSDYFNSYEDIEEYCKNKNIELRSSDKLYLGKSDIDEITMSAAISDDFRLIVFDKSYSRALYEKVINKLNEFVKNNFDEAEYQSNINLFEELTSGKYDNHFVKHVMDYIKYICMNSRTEEEMKKTIEKYYFGLSQKLDSLYKKYKNKNLGFLLEKLYENEDYVIGCHATSYKPDGDIVEDDSIFANGIRESVRGQANEMRYTIAYNIPFLEVLDYDQNRYGDVAGGYAYILAIPKDVVMQKEPLWGIGEDGKSYIMPQFITGKYKQFDEEATFIWNFNSKKKEYDRKEVDRSK